MRIDAAEIANAALGLVIPPPGTASLQIIFAEAALVRGLVSALERDKPAKRRIREAVLSGLDVTCQTIFESGIAGNSNDEVVPAMELLQRQVAVKLVPGLE